MSKTNYLEALILDWVFLEEDMPAAVPPYLALFTIAPGETGGGSEVSGAGYARVNTTGKWTADTEGDEVTNNATITFPTPAANWGTVVAFGIFDAATGGNLLRYANLTTSKPVNSGDPPSFGSGTLVFREE
jgi:hypothetical protein